MRINFPDNTSLKLLIDYVSQSLSINIHYDEQIASQKITIKAPTSIPRESLLPLLESVLRAKGLVLADEDVPGWKRIVQVNTLGSVARPQTRPARGNEPAVVAQLFELQHVEPQKVEPIIKPFLTQPGGSSLIIAEQRLLIVTDLSSNMRRISDVVKMVDQPRQQVQVQFVPIKHIEASAAGQQLNQILSAKGKAQGISAAAAASEALEMAQDNRTNQLVLIGSLPRIGEALKILDSIDVALAGQTRVYQFTSGSPQRVDKLVRDLIGPLAAKTQYQSAVDQDSRLLIVHATDDVHKKVEQLKADLDAPLKQEQSPIRFYKLANTTAANVLATISAIESPESGGAAVLQDRSSRSAPTRRAQSLTSSALPPLGVSGGGAGGGSSAARLDPLDRPATAERSEETRQAVQTIKTQKATITADPNTNSIIVVADPESQQVYEQMIKMLDKRRPQVLLECIIVTLDTSNNFSFGVEIGGSGQDDDGDPRFVTFSSFGLSSTNPKTGRLALRPGLGFNGTLLSTDIADVVVRALSTNAKAKVISAPKILVNDNATGTLASIAEAPFTSINASDTVATTSFAGYATAGTTITLTPHINADGEHLQLEYAIALNNFSGQGGSGIPPPRQTNTVSSEITIPDGNTIVVGGLNRQDESKTVTSLPILGKIPGLEYLFSNRTKNKSSSTLFVFIRPIILRDDEFEDLKFLSERDTQAAGVAADYPSSEPLPLK